MQMGKVILAMDRDMQQLRRQDCFLFFMQAGSKGLFPLLTQEAQQWHQKVQSQQLDPYQTPLKVSLLTCMLKELQARVDQIAACTPTDPLWTAAVQKGTLNADGSWPYQTWSHQEKKLIVAKKPPRR